MPSDIRPARQLQTMYTCQNAARYANCRWCERLREARREKGCSVDVDDLGLGSNWKFPRLVGV
jgi:hypothetical protein